MCIVLYIYIYAMIYAKYGIVIFKAYMLNWRRGVNMP